MSRTNSQPTIYNRIIGEYTKGFMSNNISGNSIGSVLKGMEYRPDLLAEYYLGDGTLGWAIIMINGFEKGIEEFTPGRKIIIPNI